MVIGSVAGKRWCRTVSVLEVKAYLESDCREELANAGPLSMPFGEFKCRVRRHVDGNVPFWRLCMCEKEEEG